MVLSEVMYLNFNCLKVGLLDLLDCASSFSSLHHTSGLLPTLFQLCAMQERKPIQLHFPLVFRFRGKAVECCREGVGFLHCLWVACGNLKLVQKALGSCVPG